MKDILKIKVPPFISLALVLTFLSCAFFVYIHTVAFSINQEQVNLATELATTKLDVIAANKKIERITKTTAELIESLQGEQAKNDYLASQFQTVASTVGTLEKLSKTDRELLKKYSKVYFLSENYIPLQLSLIDSAYLSNPAKPLEFHASAYPFLVRMIQAAEIDGVKLRIVSAYRSFGTQAALKSAYTVIYGAGTANQFSADQGYSEHQLGTTVDVTVPEIGTTAVSFDKTSAYSWLLANAYKYGFVLSYPKGNQYYQYEPWHWRFVGIALATRLHNEQKYFYDLEQRAIDEYLVSIFDPR